ncbi:MAG: hypothetical protein AAGB06_05235, partial [Verrucomicrobiota bacterium]
MIAKNTPTRRLFPKRPTQQSGWVLLCVFLVFQAALGRNEVSHQAGDRKGSLQILDLYANATFTREKFIRGETDSSGQLWTLSENNQIRRFDGFDWHEYGLNLNTPERLFDLKIMPDGSPWVASETGIFHFSGQGFARLNLPPKMHGYAIHGIRVSTQGLISVFGHSAGTGSLLGYLKDESWDLPALPDDFESPTFYHPGDGIEFLGSEKRLLIRKNGNAWNELISNKDSRKLAFVYSHELGIIAVGATPSEVLQIWKIDQRAQIERLDDLALPVVSKENTSVPLCSNADGVVILSVISDYHQKLYQIDSEGFRGIIDALPFAGLPIRGISTDNEGGIWLAGDEILSKLSPANSTVLTAGIPGKIVNISPNGSLWLSHKGSLYAYQDDQQTPVMQVDGVVNELGLVNGRYWFVSETGDLGYLHHVDPIYTNLAGLSDPAIAPRIAGSRGRTFAFWENGSVGGIYEWTQNEFSTLNIPVPENHRVWDVDACEDEYVWILASVPEASYNLGRWDPILEELHWQSLPIVLKDSRASAQIYPSAGSKVIVYTESAAIEVPKNLQSLSAPVFPIQGAVEHNQGAGLLLHRLADSGKSELIHFDKNEFRTYSGDLRNWTPITIDSRDILYLRNHDGSAFGRMRLGLDTSVSATHLGTFRMRHHPVFPDADTVSFTAYRSDSNRPLVATYYGSSKAPNAKARLVNIIRDRDRIESKLTFKIPFSKNHPDELRSIHASYRLGDEVWSPFRPLNSQGELEIATLPAGQHAIDVRIRNQDFVEAKEFQRLSYDLTKPSQGEAQAERHL